MPEEGTVVVQTGVSAPPPPGMFFLIIGRTSNSLQRLVVIPSIVDSDYTGEIQALVVSS